MPTITIEAFIAIASMILGAGVTAIISWRKLGPEVARIRADAAESQASAWKELTDSQAQFSESQQKRIEQLTAKLAALECEIDKIKLAREHTAEENEKLRLRI